MLESLLLFTSFHVLLGTMVDVLKYPLSQLLLALSRHNNAQLYFHAKKRIAPVPENTT